MGGNFAFTDARYVDGTAVAIDTMGVSHDLTLGPYADTSRVTGSAYFRLAPRLPQEAGEGFFRAKIFYQTEFFYTNLNDSLTPGTRIPGYSLVNLQLGGDA